MYRMPKKGRKDFTERLLAISELQPIAFEQLNLAFASLHNSRDILKTFCVACLQPKFQGLCSKNS